MIRVHGRDAMQCVLQFVLLLSKFRNSLPLKSSFFHFLTSTKRLYGIGPGIDLDLP